MTRGSRRTQRWKPANNAAGKVAWSLRRGSSVFVRPPGDPSPEGPLQLRAEFGDAILDGEPFGPTAVDELPRGDSQFPGEFLHLDSLLGHEPIPALQRLLPEDLHLQVIRQARRTMKTPPTGFVGGVHSSTPRKISVNYQTRGRRTSRRTVGRCWETASPSESAQPATYPSANPARER